MILAATKEYNRLAMAVLGDAVECLEGRASLPGFKSPEYARQERARLAREAEAWIGHDDDRGLFSFRNVCDALGIGHRLARRILLASHHGRTQLLREGA